MPVPKSVRRAARESANKKAPTGTNTPVQGAPETPKGLFILKVSGSKLKENSRGPYRSVTGVAADGKVYWAPLEICHTPKKGQMITLKGEQKGTFGEDGKYHKILGPQYLAEVVSISDQERPETDLKESLKFEGKDAEALLKTLKSLVKKHGISAILKSLGEIT